MDEVSIDEAEDDICFNAKDVFEESSVGSPIGLTYSKDESTVSWEKRKEEYIFRHEVAKCFPRKN